MTDVHLAQPSLDEVGPNRFGRAGQRTVCSARPVRYDLISANADDLVETIESAIENLETRNIGWLELRVGDN